MSIKIELKKSLDFYEACYDLKSKKRIDSDQITKFHKYLREAYAFGNDTYIDAIFLTDVSAYTDDEDIIFLANEIMEEYNIDSPKDLDILYMSW